MQGNSINPHTAQQPTLAQAPNLMITGIPGMGKSAAAKRIALNTLTRGISSGRARDGVS